MGQKIFFTVAVFVFVVFGCSEYKQKKLEMKLTNVITSYMEQRMDGFRVDSVSILGIDSLTDLDFAYFTKIILSNHEEQLYKNPALYIDPVSDKEFDEQEKLQLQLQQIQRHIAQCDSILLDEKTDTTALQYFFVGTTVYGKNKQGDKQRHEIGFPINKHFEVKEIDIFN
jgi:hypothetical protein